MVDADEVLQKSPTRHVVQVYGRQVLL